MIEIERTNTPEEFESGVLALTEIFIDEYPYYATWIKKNLEQFKNGEKQILKIKSNDELLGYLMIHFCQKNIVKINGIYIFENNKGKGMATNAIKRLTEILKQNGVDLIFVQTRLDNNAVVHLFDKNGYDLIGTNYHEIEEKNNWVACNNVSEMKVNSQTVASKIYDGFKALSPEQISALRQEYKDANLVLKKTKKNR